MVILVFPPVVAVSLFTCCKSGGEESVQRVLMIAARILAMILKKEMKDLGQEVEPKDSQIVFKKLN